LRNGDEVPEDETAPAVKRPRCLRPQHRPCQVWPLGEIVGHDDGNGSLTTAKHHQTSENSELSPTASGAVTL